MKLQFNESVYWTEIKNLIISFILVAVLSFGFHALRYNEQPDAFEKRQRYMKNVSEYLNSKTCTKNLRFQF